jgi:hypothetical protein
MTYYQRLSLLELSLLKKSFVAFIDEWIFTWDSVVGHLNFLEKQNMVRWNNLGVLFHTKYMTFANLFSLGNLYTNAIFYNFLFFIGQLLLYKTFYTMQPQKKYLFLLGIFLIPSIIFWCSGIHKDGWILSGVGALVYLTHLNQIQFKVKYLFGILLVLLFLLFMRYFYFICLLPPYLMWLITAKSKWKLTSFCLAYGLGFLLFFNLKSINPRIDPMQLVVNRQTEFIAIRGYSDMRLPHLDNSVGSFIDLFPIALNHVFTKPNFDWNGPWKYRVAALDNYLVLLLIGISLFYLKRKNFNHSMPLMLLFLSLSVLLFIGYSVPNAGALVRYKSLFIALLLPSLFYLSEIPWITKYLSKFSTSK